MKRLLIVVAVVLLIIGLPIAVSQFRNTTPTTTTPSGSYVALGDSVAAGVGLGKYVDASACNRTTESYPQQLAARKNLALTSFACSGATLPAGISGPQTVNRLALPTQTSQLFAQKTPDLVTLTVGANDVGWTELLKKCYVATCGDTTDEAAMSVRLANLTAAVTKLLNDQKSHYGSTPPPTLVTGYYQVFPDTAPSACTDLIGIDNSELAFGRRLQAGISEALKTAAETSGAATYVPLDFSGHELCTTDSWVQGLGDKQPYHPTKAGQTVITNQLAKVLQ